MITLGSEAKPLSVSSLKLAVSPAVFGPSPSKFFPNVFKGHGDRGACVFEKFRVFSMFADQVPDNILIVDLPTCFHLKLGCEPYEFVA